MTLTAATLLAVGLLIGAAWGSSRQRKRNDRRHAHLVSADAGQRSAIRDLYVAEGYEPPDFYADAEPEPRPRWWTRAWAALRTRKAARASFANHDGGLTGTCPDCGNELQSSMHWEECLRHAVEVEDEAVDPNPATQPIVMPTPTGPTTQPDLKQAAQVAPLPSFEEWKAQFDARVEADMAEIRGTK